MILPPCTEAELLKRAQAIAGHTLFELATLHQAPLPNQQLDKEIPFKNSDKNLLYAKGWFGQLLEKQLGTTAGTKSAPDFEQLGIELKTIPIDANGKPKESTYVCVVPLKNNDGLQWRESSVYKKLAKVLWVPFEADKQIALENRRIGMPLLWSPSHEQENTLKQDWEELMELVCLGKVESITAHQGVYLQIRPKAADSKSIRKGIGLQGETIDTMPRGFYLRTCFTQKILEENYVIGSKV